MQLQLVYRHLLNIDVKFKFKNKSFFILCQFIYFYSPFYSAAHNFDTKPKQACSLKFTNELTLLVLFGTQKHALCLLQIFLLLIRVHKKLADQIQHATEHAYNYSSMCSSEHILVHVLENILSILRYFLRKKC